MNALPGEPDTMYDEDTWEDAVRDLYMRSADMEVDEFEVLLSVAIRGERPEHPDLPLFLAPVMERFSH